jgi:DNA-3-methyladenine glycosylase II
MGAASFEIAVAAPFRLDLTAWALRRRGHNAIDIWDGSSRRVAVLSTRPVRLDVRRERRRGDPLLVVEVHAGRGDPGGPGLATASRFLTRALGL